MADVFARHELTGALYSTMWSIRPENHALLLNPFSKYMHVCLRLVERVKGMAQEFVYDYEVG